jgi:hypothetical protein
MARTDRAAARDRTLARAARLFVLLEERRTLCDRMRAIVEPLQRSRLVFADGEAELLERLSGRLEAALALLREYGGEDRAADAAGLLDELARQVESDDWALGQEMHAELERKALQEADIVRGFQSAIDQWTTRVAGLKQALDAALLVHAPVRREIDRHQSLEALVRSGQTAITDRAYSTLPEVLHKLDAEQAAANVDDAAAAVRAKREETRPFSRIGELLLLQSPLDQKRRYHYTVLLRMPGERGHGINVQASTTLVENDRRSMTDALGRVTHAIEHGLERIRKGATAEPPPQVSVPAIGLQPSEHDRIRRALWDTDGDAKDAPANLGALVQDVGEMMYRLFMPEQMQRQIAETRCALTITTNDLELPWELMHAQGKFLSLERPVARMPMGRALPPADRAAAPRADRLLRFLLIYADPEKNLANAEQEIETVRQYLERDWKSRIRVDVLAGERATGRRLNEVLRSGTYDVIHYAGHAHFDQESHELSGLYVGDGQESEVFFAQKIRRLMAGRPLVFLNACETGVTANEAQGQERVTYFQQPAEGLASAFIYGGALGCIGSLWPVYDRPAAEFAVEFYKGLLEGTMIGEALRATRVEIRNRYPDQIAWASYLYYGDPTAVLAE